MQDKASVTDYKISLDRRAAVGHSADAARFQFKDNERPTVCKNSGFQRFVKKRITSKM